MRAHGGGFEQVAISVVAVGVWKRIPLHQTTLHFDIAIVKCRTSFSRCIYPSKPWPLCAAGLGCAVFFGASLLHAALPPLPEVHFLEADPLHCQDCGGKGHVSAASRGYPPFRSHSARVRPPLKDIADRRASKALQGRSRKGGRFCTKEGWERTSRVGDGQPSWYGGATAS